MMRASKGILTPMYTDRYVLTHFRALKVMHAYASAVRMTF